MTPQEENGVFSRLAASDVASQIHQEIGSDANKSQRGDDERAALANIMKELPMPYPERASQLCALLITHLQKSDLTVNFRAQDFFAAKPGKEFVNTWQKNNNGGGYLETRDQTEENLFGYSNTSKKSGVKDVMDRIKKFGALSGGSNPSFEASIRPKYAALNYGRQKNGSATIYGNSFMVLKEHIKHNSTFTAMDSFRYASIPDAGTKVANYHHLDRLIANMGADTLKKLYNAATSSSLKLKAPGSSHYVEAQVHAAIQFNRDVKKIYVANMELGGNSKALRETIEKFTKKNGILLEFI